MRDYGARSNNGGEFFDPFHTQSGTNIQKAGTLFRELYQFAEDHGITVVGGSDRTVGPSGGWVIASLQISIRSETATDIFWQGGGHSMLSNNFGLGADRVLQYRVVTPQGEYLTANACQNTDLFYALRGGGGGTFGVVMESTFLAEPRPLTIQVYVMLLGFTCCGLILRCIQGENFFPQNE